MWGMGDRSREAGFTLIELLWVCVVLAVLAAIIVPTFMHQRARGYEAQAKASLKDASMVIQSWVTQHNRDYSELDGKTGADEEFTGEGFRPTGGVAVDVKASATAYCLTANHSGLDSDWKYSSAAGRAEEGACSSAAG